jgi:REP element-mobilizing transposase RayT
MPKRKILLSAGNTYHIYNKAVADNLLFLGDENYYFFISKIQEHLLDVADILAYCLMPNHYHMLIKLRNDDLSAAMQKLALSYVVPFNSYFQRSGHLFQGSYQIKFVEDDRYLIHLSRYIHLNPVAAMLVAKPENWDFSSAQEYLGMKSVNFIKPKIVLDLLDDYRGSALIEKQKRYKEFLEDWDPEYMAFKQK